MYIGSNVRLFLARRPWIHWLTIALLAATIGLGVRAQLGAVGDARDEWADTKSVLVADRDLEPGEAVSASPVELPLVAVPPSAITDPDDATTPLRQRVAAGEVLVRADIAAGRGPAAGADDGFVVVPVSDPLVVSADIGLDVAIYAEGIVLAAAATVVHTEGEVIFVAVDADDAPIVAAAAQNRTASIVFTR